MIKSYQICCSKCNNNHNFYRYGKDKYGKQKYICRVRGYQFAPDSQVEKPERPYMRPYPTCSVCGKAMFLYHGNKYYSNYKCSNKKRAILFLYPYLPPSRHLPYKLSGKTNFRRMPLLRLPR